MAKSKAEPKAKSKTVLVEELRGIDSEITAKRAEIVAATKAAIETIYAARPEQIIAKMGSNAVRATTQKLTAYQARIGNILAQEQTKAEIALSKVEMGTHNVRNSIFGIANGAIGQLDTILHDDYDIIAIGAPTAGELTQATPLFQRIGELEKILWRRDTAKDALDKIEEKEAVESALQRLKDVQGKK